MEQASLNPKEYELPSGLKKIRRETRQFSMSWAHEPPRNTRLQEPLTDRIGL